MSTTTDHPAPAAEAQPAPVPLAPGTFATIDEAIAHARTLAPGVPLIAHNADGSVRVDAIVTGPPPTYTGNAPDLTAEGLDSRGRAVVGDEAAGADALRALFDSWEAEDRDAPAGEGIEVLRAIDAERPEGAKLFERYTAAGGR